MVHAAAARAMQDPMMLAVLAAGCAVAEGALPEREPHPRVFAGLIQLVRQLEDTSLVADFVRWEAMLLADLGYGLDLAACALTGATAGLRWVSPRTGRAVTETAAGVWKGRLLALPDFLADGNGGEDGNDPGAWRDGLRLTGHFLERDAFGHTHRPMPPARYALYDRVTARIARGTGEQEDQTS
jgi:DNA repair protein RecO (recombination protein O)